MKNLGFKIAMLIGVIGFTIACSSCACWTDATKRNDVGCIVAHDVVDCTVGGAKDVLPYFATIVMGLITGGIDPNNIPWDDIEMQAEGMGIKDGGCFLAELKNLFFSKPASSPALMAARKSLDSHLDKFKQKHFGSTSVKFKIRDREGKEVLL